MPHCINVQLIKTCENNINEKLQHGFIILKTILMFSFLMPDNMKLFWRFNEL